MVKRVLASPMVLPAVTHQVDWGIPDVLLNILKNLTLYKDIKSFSLACKQVHLIISDDIFWQRLYQSRVSYGSDNLARSFEKKFINYSNRLHNICHSSFIQLFGSAYECMAYQDKLVLAVERAVDITTIGVFQSFFNNYLNNVNDDYISRFYLKIKDNCKDSFINLYFIEFLDLKTLEKKILFFSEEIIPTDLAYCEDNIVFMRDRQLAVLNLNTLEYSQREIDTGGSCISCLFSDPDHQRIILIPNRGIITGWAKDQISRLQVLGTDEKVTASCLDGERLITGSPGGKISIFDLTKQTNIYEVQAYPDTAYSPVSALVIHKNQLFSSGANNNSILVWDSKTLASQGAIDFSNFKTDTHNGRVRYYMVYEGMPSPRMGKGSPKEKDVLWNPKTQESTILDGEFLAIHDGKLITKWALGIQIQDYSIPAYEIKYPLLEHLGIVSLKDYREKLNLEPKNLFEQIQNEGDYHQFQELCKFQLGVPISSQIMELKRFLQELSNRNQKEW